MDAEQGVGRRLLVIVTIGLVLIGAAALYKLTPHYERLYQLSILPPREGQACHASLRDSGGSCLLAYAKAEAGFQIDRILPQKDAPGLSQFTVFDGPADRASPLFVQKARTPWVLAKGANSGLYLMVWDDEGCSGQPKQRTLSTSKSASFEPTDALSSGDLLYVLGRTAQGTQTRLDIYRLGQSARLLKSEVLGQSSLSGEGCRPALSAVGSHVLAYCLSTDKIKRERLLICVYSGAQQEKRVDITGAAISSVSCFSHPNGGGNTCWITLSGGQGIGVTYCAINDENKKMELTPEGEGIMLMVPESHISALVLSDGYQGGLGIGYCDSKTLALRYGQMAEAWPGPFTLPRTRVLAKGRGKSQISRVLPINFDNGHYLICEYSDPPQLELVQLPAPPPAEDEEDYIADPE